MTKTEKYYPRGPNVTGEKYRVLKYFVRYCLYRNLANYDTMILLTGNKGCFFYDTVVTTSKGDIKIGKLVGQTVNLQSWNNTRKKTEASIGEVFYTGKQEVFKVQLENHKVIECTKEHKFLCGQRFRKLSELDVGDSILFLNEGYLNILSIKSLGIQKTYDISVNKFHNYILANGAITHNSGKSSFALMLGLEWCRLLGLRFNPTNNVLYSNEQVRDALDSLEKFSVAILDESVNFCVFSKTFISCHGKRVMIKNLVNKNIKIKTYNKYTNKVELKNYSEVIKTKRATVYELKSSDGKRIQCTWEHNFLTPEGYKPLCELNVGDEVIVLNKVPTIVKIKSITKKGIEDVYDILDVVDNPNFVANGFIVHNCSAAEWNKVENRELRKKIAQVRTRHLFFILCWPMKVDKIQKDYLDSFVNYWIHLIKRGVGAIFVKDINPVTDSWRLSLFKDLGGFTEFTGMDKIKKKLKGHPNFWHIITAPKPSAEFYSKYLVVREKNVYNTDGILSNTSRQDIYKAVLIKILQEIMQRESTMISMKRLLPHIKADFGIDLKESDLKGVMSDAEMLLDKLKKEKHSLLKFDDEKAPNKVNVELTEADEKDYMDGN